MAKQTKKGLQNTLQKYSAITDLNFQYLGNDFFWCCGDITISLRDFYKIHKTNALINKYYRKIVAMVAKYGIQVVDWEGNVANISDKDMQKIKQFFAIPNFDLFKQQLFTQAFCSGNVFGIVWQVNGAGEMKAKILDSRGFTINVDKYGDPINYSYNGGRNAQSETFSPDSLYHQIVFYNPDKPYEGLSIYNGIVVDALSDYETGKRQLYFFKNNARPDLIVMLDEGALQDEQTVEYLKNQRTKQYAGSSNAHKPVFSAGVKDIKTISPSNVELDLLNLRRFNDTKIAMMFGIDKRLVGYDKDTGGSRAEIDVVSQINGNAQIREYAVILEDFMTEMIKKFLLPNFEYRINAINDTFKNDQEDKKIMLALVQNGCITRKEYRQEFDYPIEELPDNMDRFTIQNNNIFIDEPVVQSPPA